MINVSQSVLSTSFIQIQVSVLSPVGYDPSGDPVQFAFTPQTYPPTYPTVGFYPDSLSIPGPSTFPSDASGWVSGSWSVDPGPAYWAQCLVGPGGTVALGTGTYQVWVKVTDDPAVPVLQQVILEVV